MRALRAAGYNHGWEIPPVDGSGTAMGQRRTIAGSRMLITGASQGIGQALALAAAARGARVLAGARNAELLSQLAGGVRAAGGVLETVQADVTSADDRRRMVEAAVQHFGGL